MVCTPSDLEQCFTDSPEYRGQVFVGVDIGESSSGSAAVAYWPETGAMKSWLAFGDVPTLVDRSRRDGSDYSSMERRGELRTYPGRVVPVGAFLEDVRADLADVDVRTAVADGYKSAETFGRLPVARSDCALRCGAGRLRVGEGVPAVRLDTHACDGAESFLNQRDRGKRAAARRKR